MEIKIHEINNSQIAELISEEIIINDASEGLDILGNIYYQGIDKLILYERNLNPTFFDLSSGLAGELLQKFSNYSVRMVIVGDFDKFSAESLKDFIFESNKHGHVNFLPNLETAIQKLSK